MRLYPVSGSVLFVRAFVHPTRKLFVARLRSLAGNERMQFRDSLAVCTDVRRWVNGRRDPCVAEVNFYRHRFTDEIIAHEFFHATICWGRRIGFNWHRFEDEDSVNEDEERMARVHGSLIREFTSRLGAPWTNAH